MLRRIADLLQHQMVLYLTSSIRLRFVESPWQGDQVKSGAFRIYIENQLPMGRLAQGH